LTADLLNRSLVGVSRSLANREVSAAEVVAAVLEQIERTDETVGAFSSVQAGAALARANELDEGPVVGPLHGVPIALKDLIFTTGVATEANCDALAGFVPDHNATVVDRLAGAGAIIIGKTNTHELAFGVSCPVSHNPWNPDRMTGGSSGGSAAAVSARQVFGALGTDTGGSVRIPANYCGITGIKTTRGAVPRAGIHLISWTYDTVGPMARTAEDCLALLEVMAGHAADDPYSAKQPLLPAAEVDGLTLGVPPEAWLHNAGTVEAVGATLHTAVETLAAIVGQVRAVTPPSGEDHAQHGSAIVFAESAALTATLRAEANDRFGDEVRGILSAGAEVSGVDLATAQDVRQQLQQDWQMLFDEQGVDLIIAPVNPNQVLPHGLTELGGLPLIPATTQFTFPVNGAGLPAIALPGGFDADGLPIGFQLIGRPFSERTLAAVGAAFQTATGHHLQVPAVASS
jgi:aspartyl-tRNA(Asn)/glutamyl-tRNA(Gln) amidotransferase subunit A